MSDLRDTVQSKVVSSPIFVEIILCEYERSRPNTRKCVSYMYCVMITLAIKCSIYVEQMWVINKNNNDSKLLSKILCIAFSENRTVFFSLFQYYLFFIYFPCIFPEWHVRHMILISLNHSVTYIIVWVVWDLYICLNGVK